jgi:hypothetical protein
MAPFAHSMASMGPANPRAMGTDAMTGVHIMKVKTHVRAGTVLVIAPGGRCGT